MYNVGGREEGVDDGEQFLRPKVKGQLQCTCLEAHESFILVGPQEKKLRK